MSSRRCLGVSDIWCDRRTIDFRSTRRTCADAEHQLFSASTRRVSRRNCLPAIRRVTTNSHAMGFSTRRRVVRSSVSASCATSCASCARRHHIRANPCAALSSVSHLVSVADCPSAGVSRSSGCIGVAATRRCSCRASLHVLHWSSPHPSCRYSRVNRLTQPTAAYWSEPRLNRVAM